VALPSKRRDQNRILLSRLKARVLEVLNRYRDRPLADFVVTTNHVVAETVTLLRNKAGADPRARHALACSGVVSRR